MTTETEEITCPACFEVFRDPVSLNCQHTLCSPCAKDITSGGNIACLLCQAITSPGKGGELPRNRQKAELIALLRDQAGAVKAVVCDNCDKETATLQCEECREPLCQSCSDAIHALGRRAHHNVLPYGQISLDKCAVHGGNLRFYCGQCKVTVCSDCLLLDAHKSHSYCTVDEAADKSRQELQAFLQNVEGRKRRLMDQIRHLIRMQELLFKQTEAAQGSIVAAFAQLEAQISQRRAALLDQVSGYASAGQRSIEEQRRVVFGGVSKLNLVHLQLDATARNPRTGDILSQRAVQLAINSHETVRSTEHQSLTHVPNVLVPGLEADAAGLQQQILAFGKVTLAEIPKKDAGGVRTSGMKKAAQQTMHMLSALKSPVRPAGDGNLNQSPLQVGDKVDAQDNTQGNWFHATILSVKGDKVEVHFGGAERGWNESFSLKTSASRLAQYRSQVPQCSKACGYCQ